LIQPADEVAINVVRVIFVFRERAVCENIAYSDVPELLHENLEIVDQVGPPGRVPRGILIPVGTQDENRMTEFIK
jgi:hypothetical protein